MSAKGKRIAIVTDSTSDIPAAVREQHGIHMVPLLLTWGEETLRVGQDIDAEGFYERLQVDPVHPRTSQPSVGDFVEAFERLGEEADEVVAVLISSELSGTITAAESAKDMVDIPIHIVDSRASSLGQAVAVYAAVAARDAGGDAEAIVTAARERVAKTRVVIMVDTLEYLHKGGRIGGAQKLLGSALDLKPVLHLVDGILEPLDRVRTRSKAIKRMLDSAADGLDMDAPLGGAVLHADAHDDALAVAERYKERYAPQEFFEANVTPIIGVHVGPGALGLVTYNL